MYTVRIRRENKQNPTYSMVYQAITSLGGSYFVVLIGAVTKSMQSLLMNVKSSPIVRVRHLKHLRSLSAQNTKWLCLLPHSAITFRVLGQSHDSYSRMM